MRRRCRLVPVYWIWKFGTPVEVAALAPTQLSAFDVPKDMIPGDPPVMVVSVTLIRATPFCRNEIVEPTAVSVSCVPDASGPELNELPSWTRSRRCARTPAVAGSTVPEVDP